MIANRHDFFIKGFPPIRKLVSYSPLMTDFDGGSAFTY